jgi:rhodanese-related sulfurtransferase
MRSLLLSTSLLAIVSLTLPGQTLTTEQLDKALKDNKVFFLDVREPDEIRKLGSVKGYVNIPVGELEKRAGEIPKDKVIVTL